MRTLEGIQGREGDRRRLTARASVPAAAVALLICCSVQPGAAEARPAGAAATASAPVSVTVKTLTTTQEQLANDKGLRVRITAAGRGLVGVSLGDETGRKLSNGKGLAFGAEGSRTVTLNLDSAGRARSRSCSTGRQIWTVTTKSGNWTITRTVRLVADEIRCLPPEPAAKCHGGDPLDRYRCGLPFPNDYYSREDQTAPTGRRLALQSDLMASNDEGIRINPAPYNRNDGFSGNSAILTRVPGLDTAAALTASGAATINNIGRYLDPEAPIVVIDTATGERWPIWSEVDASTNEVNDRLLITRGAKVFAEGHRYIVAMRNLKRADGTAIPAKEIFRWYRDNSIPATAPDSVKQRKAHMEEIFSALDDAGIERSSLYQAWDFTVASRENVTGPALKMRDDAFALLGDTNLADGVAQGQSPEVTVTTVQNYTLGESRYVLRRIDGKVKVPCFMGNRTYSGRTPGYCAPGTRINPGPDGLPEQSVDSDGKPVFYDAKFTCIVPRQSEDSTAMGNDRRAVLFGHGLLGTGADVTAIRDRAGLEKAVACGADWIGLSKEDIGDALGTLLNLDRFPALADRSVQGLINFLYLGRWMISQAPGGMNSTPGFIPDSGVLADPDQKLYNLGGSQGGIMGTALTALAPDFERSLLAVPAVGYSTLLNRSAAFEIFGPPVRQGYPDPATQQLLLSQVQTLWDRGEGGGYVHHVTTDPLPNTPTHKVMMVEAFGDHLVTNIQTETMARTIGATLRSPALDPDRSPDVEPFYGIERGAADLFNGAGLDTSAGLVVIDIGPLRGTAPNFRGVTPAPPVNLPPTPAKGMNGNNGIDPHADVAKSDTSVALLFEFLKPGGSVLTQFACGTKPCYAEGWTGP